MAVHAVVLSARYLPTHGRDLHGADARYTLAAGALRRQVVGAVGLLVFGSDDCAHWSFTAAAADPAFQAAVAAKLPAWCDMPTSCRDFELWIRAYDEDPKPCPDLPPHLTMGAAPPEAWCYDATEAHAAVERWVKKPGGRELWAALHVLGLRCGDQIRDPTAVLEILRRFAFPEPHHGEEPPTFADLAGFFSWVLRMEEEELKECAEETRVAEDARVYAASRDNLLKASAALALAHTRAAARRRQEAATVAEEFDAVFADGEVDVDAAAISSLHQREPDGPGQRRNHPVSWDVASSGPNFRIL